MINKYFLTIVLVLPILLTSCGAHYVELKDLSNKIDLNCYSIVLPEDEDWNKRTYSIPPPPETCKNDELYISQSEDSVLLLRFISNLGDWQDKYDNQYLYDKREKSLSQQKEKNRFSRINTFKEYGVEDFQYSVKPIEYFKTINTMSIVEYNSTKPLWKGMSADKLIDSILKESEKYYYEEVNIHAIDGPFKLLFGRGAINYTVYFAFISSKKINDSELENKALKFLNNIEYTGDYGERIE